MFPNLLPATAPGQPGVADEEAVDGPAGQEEVEEGEEAGEEELEQVDVVEDVVGVEAEGGDCPVVHHGHLGKLLQILK